MKQRIFPVIIVLLFFAACAPKQPEQDTDIIPMEPNTDVLTPIKPNCEPDDRGPSVHSIYSPIDAASPLTLTWDIDCKPNEYAIKIIPFKDESSPIWTSTFAPSSPNMGEWTESIPLEPATNYQWRLQAFDDNGNLLQIKTSEWAVFRTGPLCSVEDLVTPTLLLPEDGTIDTGKGYGNVSEVIATIKYPVSECFPNYFELEFSTNTNFIEEKNLNPAGTAYGKKEGEWWVYMDETSGTQNCNLYYWRARAVVDEGFGDWSEMFNFYLDVYGNCFKFPEFKGIQNANCRSDPWAGENYVSVIWEGDTAELLGLNEDASWGIFKLKNELECWVKMDMVEPDPPDAVFFPGYYPVLEHGEPPDDLPAPSSGDEPVDEEIPVGCMVPSDRSGNLVCQIPCPDPQYAARVCP